MRSKVLHLLLLFCAMLSIAQEKEAVTTTIDRDVVKIGEEVLLQLEVNGVPDDFVVFPEQPTMGAMEVINSYPIDSVKGENQLQLFKRYGLTQFDSGAYWIPKLSIIKNNKRLFSDSLLVRVNTVAVDTTKQKLYPIKDEVEIATNPPFNWSLLLWLLLFIPIAGLVYLLTRKKVEKSYEDTLAPYEWTKYRLQKLEESNLLDNRDWKGYYTELTFILRKYIDSKVYDHALESTTKELVEALKETLIEKGMTITEKSKTKLEEILQKADLIKFAGISGDVLSAKEDRNRTSDIIYNIHQVLPPPSEEELMLSAAYQRKKDRQKKTKNIVIWSSAAVFALLISLGAWSYFVGTQNVKDYILGNTLRTFHDATWVTADYGTPSIQISLPEVMIRQDSLMGETALNKYIATSDAYHWGDFSSEFAVVLSTFTIDAQQSIRDEKSSFDEIKEQLILEPFLAYMEQHGAKNIIMLDAEIETNGVKGLEVTGNYIHHDTDYKYTMRYYTMGTGVLQLLVTHKKDEEKEPKRQFGQRIEDRIMNSITIDQPDNKQKQ